MSQSSPATVVAIVLSAMKNKRDPATYGTSYATVMNEDIAQKAARDIADIYAALQPSSAATVTPPDDDELIGLNARLSDALAEIKQLRASLAAKSEPKARCPHCGEIGDHDGYCGVC